MASDHILTISLPSCADRTRRVLDATAARAGRLLRRERGWTRRRERRPARSATADQRCTEAVDLGLQVERTDPGVGVGRQRVGRYDPADLELEAVGIMRVQALGGTVVAGADQRSCR